MRHLLDRFVAFLLLLTLALPASAQQLNPYNVVVGTTAGTVASGVDSRIVGALQSVNNLSDVSNVVTARANIGAANAADTITVYLNDYATPTLSGTDGAVTGTTLTSASVTFSAVNVGNYVLVRGAGTGGSSFITTISNYVSAHSVTLATAAPINVTGSLFYYGADATAGVTAAFANAAATNAAIKGRGAFWLATQTTPINLSGVSVSNDGGPISGFSPYQSALTFLVTQSSVPTFDVGVGVTFGASVFYPAQDGSAVTPLVYPAVFDVPAAGVLTNVTISGATFVNPYVLFSVEPTATGGRLWMGNATKAYCVSRCFDIRNGLADTIQTDNTVYFGPGVYGDTATTGAAYLQLWTAANGEVFHLDPAGTGSTYSHVDGLLVHGGIWQGYRYGIRLLSGILDVGDVTGLDCDSVPTALSVEGSSYAILPWTGGEIYSSQVGMATANADTFSVSTSNGLTVLVITGVSVPFSQGNVVNITSFGINRLTLTSNDFGGWGQTTSTGGGYFAVRLTNPATVSTADISGNTFSTSSTTGNASNGVLMNGGNLVLANNVFKTVTTPIWFTASSGSAIMKGNQVYATAASASVVNTASGTFSLTGDASDNLFDKPSVPVLSGAGASAPALPATANDNIGVVTEGTSATGFTLTFGTAFLVAPRCTVNTQSGILFSYSTSTTALVATHSSSNNNKFVYRCTA